MRTYNRRQTSFFQKRALWNIVSLQNLYPSCSIEIFCLTCFSHIFKMIVRWKQTFSANRGVSFFFLLQLLELKPKTYGVAHRENQSGRGDGIIHYSKGHALNPSGRDWKRYQAWQPENPNSDAKSSPTSPNSVQPFVVYLCASVILELEQQRFQLSCLLQLFAHNFNSLVLLREDRWISNLNMYSMLTSIQ